MSQLKSLVAVAALALAWPVFAAEPVVTIVRVAKPWYAPDFYVRGAFAKAVPQYQSIPGLVHKSFTLSADGRLGGIYQWRDRAAAEAWFNPAWFARVRERYGVDGTVSFYTLQSAEVAGSTALVTDSPAVATLRTQVVPAAALPDSALRRYRLTDAAGAHWELVLWRDAEAAPVDGLPAGDRFAASVLMPGLAADANATAR
jgi:hypothetical protein